jgi:DNA mismatch endonuclease, patch repair protein
MAQIRAKGNRSTELRVIKLLKQWRVCGWRRNYPLLGRPDFVFREKRCALFADGCFWHGCPVHGRVPSSNVDYWSQKIARNRKRDRQVKRELARKGWRVLRIWEHELTNRNAGDLERKLKVFLALPTSPRGRHGASSLELF